MVNFVEAYKTGLDFAELADKRKQEVDAVFKNLNEQLSEVTEGKLYISIKNSLAPDSLLASPTNMLKTLLTRQVYDAIVAENPFVKSSTIELARWEQDRSGYPCKISIISSGETIYCEDKSGLEEGLAQLLCDPAVGKILHNLVNLPQVDETISY
jgi:hypothetical protein